MIRIKSNIVEQELTVEAPQAKSVKLFTSQIPNQLNLAIMSTIKGDKGETGSQGIQGERGETGKGFTGGFYDSLSGIVTFTSLDGLGFITEDLRGADGESATDTWGSLLGNISDQTDLQAELDAKSNIGHTHLINDITNLQTSLDAKSNIGHTHLIGDITDFTDNSTNWDTAFGWGNHATVGYLTSFTETDPIFTASPAFGITNGDIINWDTAFGWGDHSGLYSSVGHTHTEADITDLKDYLLPSDISVSVQPYNANTTVQGVITLNSLSGTLDHNDLSNIGTNSHVDIDSHIADDTKHFTQAEISITENQISDLQDYELKSNKNVNNGFAGLDASGKINPNQLPSLAISETFVVESEALQLVLTAQTGDVVVRTDLSKSFILQGSDASVLADWQELLTPTSSVESVFGRLGVVEAQSGDYTTDQITETSGRVFLTPTQKTNFGTAFGWGDHSTQGYLTSVAFSDLTSKPTTISGYGITDFNSLGDARWSLLGHTHTFDSLSATPTTVDGYGITDFNSLGDARWLQLTDVNEFDGTYVGNTTFTGNMSVEGTDVILNSEDFSTDLGGFTNASPVLWTRVTDEGNGDLTSARSGVITDGEFSVITYDTTGATEIVVDIKVNNVSGNVSYNIQDQDFNVLLEVNDTQDWTTHSIALPTDTTSIAIVASGIGTTSPSDFMWVDNFKTLVSTAALSVIGDSVIQGNLTVQGNPVPQEVYSNDFSTTLGDFETPNRSDTTWSIIGGVAETTMAANDDSALNLETYNFEIGDVIEFDYKTSILGDSFLVYFDGTSVGFDFSTVWTTAIITVDSNMVGNYLSINPYGYSNPLTISVRNFKVLRKETITLTADKFVGDGSGLTNLNALNDEGNLVIDNPNSSGNLGLKLTYAGFDYPWSIYNNQDSLVFEDGGGNPWMIFGSFSGGIEITQDLNVLGDIQATNAITNETDIFTGTEKASKMITLTQVEYDGLTPDANTLYFII